MRGRGRLTEELAPLLLRSGMGAKLSEYPAHMYVRRWVGSYAVKGGGGIDMAVASTSIIQAHVLYAKPGERVETEAKKVVLGTR